MEVLSFLGIIVGFGALLFGNVLEGGQLNALLNPISFMIVIGGTLGAVMVHTPTKVFLKSIGAFPRVFFPPKLKAELVVKQFMMMARACKKDGSIQAGKYENKFDDAFIRKAIKMLADNAEVELIEDILRRDIDLEERNHRLHAEVYKSMGGYSPTIGLIGAILGLINVMSYLDSPSQLGHGLAVAFTATLYGVSFANLVFIPVAEKLTLLSEREANFRDMVVAGVVSIRSSENLSTTESRLRSYLDDRLTTGWN